MLCIIITSREKDLDPIKVTLEVTGKGLKIVQNLPNTKRTPDNYRVSNALTMLREKAIARANSVRMGAHMDERTMRGKNT